MIGTLLKNAFISSFFLCFISLTAQAQDCEVISSDTEGCENSSFNFQLDHDAGLTIDDINWDFDDGLSSGDESPTHIYTDPGNYTVTVTVEFDDGSTCQASTEITIFENPEADFSVDAVGDLCFSEAEDGVQFFDESTPGDGDLVEWSWDFDDGNTGVGQNPSHSFEFDGDFYPLLQVQDENDCVDEIRADDPITVLPELGVEFTTDMNVDCPETPVRFFNNSDIDTGAVDEFFWDFGDGEFDHTQENWDDFVHTYEDDGGEDGFDPMLVVTDTNDCTEVYVCEGCGNNISYYFEVEAIYDENKCYGADGGEVSFTHPPRENAQHVMWVFGDPDHDENVNDEEWWSVEHSYTGPGIYSVYYEIFEPGCFRDTTYCDFIELLGPMAMIQDDELEYSCYDHQEFPYFSGSSTIVFDTTDYYLQIGTGDHFFIYFYEGDEPDDDTKVDSIHVWFNTGLGLNPNPGIDNDKSIEVDMSEVDDDEDLIELLSDSLSINASIGSDGNIMLTERGPRARLMYADFSDMPDGLKMRINTPGRIKPPMLSWGDYLTVMDDLSLVDEEAWLEIFPDVRQMGFENTFSCGNIELDFPVLFATYDTTDIMSIPFTYNIGDDFGSEYDTMIADPIVCPAPPGELEPKYGRDSAWVDTMISHMPYDPQNNVITLSNDPAIPIHKREVIIHDTVFESRVVSAYTSDTIEWFNADNVTHEINMYYTEDGSTVFIGDIAPGETETYVIDREETGHYIFWSDVHDPGYSGSLNAYKRADILEVIVKSTNDVLEYDPRQSDHSYDPSTEVVEIDGINYHISELYFPLLQDFEEELHVYIPDSSTHFRTDDGFEIDGEFFAWDHMFLPEPSGEDCPSPLEIGSGRNSLGMNRHHIYSPYCGPPHTVDFTNFSMRFTGEREMFDQPLGIMGEELYLMHERDEHLHPNYPYASDKLEYLWEFGDGDTSTQATPTHTYDEADVYDVQLTVFDPETGCEHTASLQIVVEPPNSEKIHIRPLGEACSGSLQEYPYQVELDSVIPSEPDDLWLVHDSAAQVNYEGYCPVDQGCPDDSLISYNWMDLEALEEQGFQVNYATPGWKSVGIIVKSGHCYDTTWINDYLYVSGTQPFLETAYDTLGGASQIYDTIQPTSLDYVNPMCPGYRDVYPIRPFIVSDLRTWTTDVFDYQEDSMFYPEDFFFEWYDDATGTFDDSTGIHECVDSLYFLNHNTGFLYRTTSMYEGVNIYDDQSNLVASFSAGDTVFFPRSIISNPPFGANAPIYQGQQTVPIIHEDQSQVYRNETMEFNPALDTFNVHYRQDSVTNYQFSFTNVTSVSGADVPPITFPIEGDPSTIDDFPGADTTFARLDSNFRILYSEPGIYDINHSMGNLEGCGRTFQSELVLGHWNNLEVSDSIVCVGDEVEFSDNVYYFRRPTLDDPADVDSTNDDFYANGRIQYDFYGNGEIDTIQTQENTPIAYSWDEPGIYDVAMYTEDSNGCVMVNKQKIHVSQPQADFVTPEENYYCAGDAGQTVHFIDSSKSPQAFYNYPISRFEMDEGQYQGEQMDFYPLLVELGDSNEVYIDSITNWRWNFGDGRPDLQTRSPARTFHRNDEYTIQLSVETEAGCRDTIVDTVVIEGPRPSFELLTDSAGCSPFEFEAWDQSEEAQVREFEINGRTSSGGAHDTLALLSEDRVGTHEVKLTVTSPLITAAGDTINCSAFYPNPDVPGEDTTIEITVWPMDTVDFTTPVSRGELFNRDGNVRSEERYCRTDEDGNDNPILFESDIDSLAEDTFFYDEFNWTFGDGQVSTDMNPFHIYQDTGTYDVSLAPEPGRCPDEESKEIHVQDVSSAFDVDMSALPQVKFTSQAHGNDLEYEWEFGDGNTSTEENPLHTYQETGTFEVCLTVTDDIGCRKTECENIEVISEIHIPNVFSPTGDGRNDEFLVEVEGGWVDFDIVIFNRWGEKVFESNDPDEAWDGTNMNDGNDCESGTYYFILNYQLIGQDSQEVKGTVSLFR